MDLTSRSVSSDAASQNKIALRIYALSVFLSRLQFSASRDEDALSMDSMQDTTNGSSFGKVLNRIAILLTRGTDEEKARTIAVTAGPLTNTGVHARIVRATLHLQAILHTSSSSSKTTTLSSSDLHDITSFTPSNSVAMTLLDEDPTRNSKPLEKGRDEDIHLQGRVDRSPSKYASTEDDSVVFHPASFYQFHAFARLFFLILRSAGQNGRPVAAMLFAISQCAAEIFERCDIVRKKYIRPELREWLPHNDETVQPTAIDVEDEKALTLFSGSGLEGRKSTTADNLTTFAFNKGNVHLWLRALIDLVETFQESLLKMHKSHSPDTVHEVAAFSGLIHLFLTLIPVRLWTIPSLDTVLRGLRERRRAAASTLIASKGIEEPLAEEDVMNEEDDVWVDVERVVSGGNKKKRAEELKSSLPDCLAFLRAVDGLTVWTTSARALATSRFAKTELPLRYDILDLPRRELDKQDVLMQDALNHWVKRFPQLAPMTETLRNVLKDTDSLRGTCHCEAGIMADNAAPSMESHDRNTRTSQASSSDDVTPHVRIELGVNKKACPFCWMLAKALYAKQHIAFSLPGAHDYYFPWIPPASLSKEVLLDVESRGEERLHDMLYRARGVIHGNMTSPTSSDDDFSDQEREADELYAGTLKREPDGRFIHSRLKVTRKVQQ